MGNRLRNPLSPAPRLHAPPPRCEYSQHHKNQPETGTPGRNPVVGLKHLPDAAVNQSVRLSILCMAFARSTTWRRLRDINDISDIGDIGALYGIYGISGISGMHGIPCGGHRLLHKVPVSILVESMQPFFPIKEEAPLPKGIVPAHRPASAPSPVPGKRLHRFTVTTPRVFIRGGNVWRIS